MTTRLSNQSKAKQKLLLPSYFQFKQYKQTSTLLLPLTINYFQNIKKKLHLNPSMAAAATTPPPPSSFPSPLLSFLKPLQHSSSPPLLFHPSLDSSSTQSSSSSSSISFKRGRPAPLHIPPTSPPTFFTHTLSLSPSHDLSEVEVDGGGLPSYAVFSKRGKRGPNEDRFSHIVNIHGNPKQAFFGVFDGHGGDRAAEFAARRMHGNIMEEVGKTCGGEYEVKEAVRRGYLKTDSEFIGEEGGGACCVTALIREGFLFASNAGDCRAVVSRNGVALALTSDHRPSRVDERTRIESMGGYVDFFHGAWRINGTLGVSRAIGDGNLKPWVTAEPETRFIRIEENDEFLILGSDGLWEKVWNQEGVEVVGTELRTSPSDKFDRNLVSSACRKLGEMAAKRGCIDDITVVLVILRGWML